MFLFLRSFFVAVVVSHTLSVLPTAPIHHDKKAPNHKLKVETGHKTIHRVASSFNPIATPSCHVFCGRSTRPKPSTPLVRVLPPVTVFLVFFIL